MSDVALNAADLKIIRGSRMVLTGMSFQVRQGEVYALLGGNGTGKSTTLLTFMGLLQPSAGVAEVLGKSAASQPAEVRSQIAYLPESAALYDHLNAVENLRYFLSLCQARPEQDALDTALESVNLPPNSWSQPLHSYSKGMRQKTAIALALLRKSPVLLLDEPTSGLDPAAVEDFHGIIENLAGEGVTVLMVTHDMFGACQVAHRVGLLREGLIVEQFEADREGAIDMAAVRDELLQRQTA